MNFADRIATMAAQVNEMYEAEAGMRMVVIPVPIANALVQAGLIRQDAQGRWGWVGGFPDNEQHGGG